MALPLSYNWRNLFVRRLSTGLTFCVVTLVVLVLTVLLSFAAGIRASLIRSGSPVNLIVLAPGATAESTSIITNEQLSRAPEIPGVARDAKGRLLISPELCTQTSIPRKNARDEMANVAVRGVDDAAFDVHSDVRMVAGRRFQPGAMEIIVGKAAQQRYADLDIGCELHLGRMANRVYKVVGVFEAGGGALESEIWGQRSLLSDSFNRRLISSIALRLQDAAAAEPAISNIDGPSVQLAGKRETDYYDDLAKTAREIEILARVLIAIMAVGAVFAVANTMYAAVDARRREIAVLRTLGFARGSILLAFVAESLLICTAACLVGIGLSLLVSGRRQDFLSDMTWTVLAYEMKVTPAVIVNALLVSTLVGVFGALAPAVRASRVRVIEALRKA